MTNDLKATTTQGLPFGGMPLLFSALIVATVLWFLMFAVDGVPFWPTMAAATLVLGSGSLGVYRGTLKAKRVRWVSYAIIGVVSAVVLYFIFAIGKELVELLLPNGSRQIANVYATRQQAPTALIGFLLLFPIGPGEELFWRGWVQRALMERWGTWPGYVIATLLYIAVHIPSMNLTLIGAAGVAGAFWGFMYIKYRHIGPGIVSHALWDIFAFIILPFM